MKSSKIPYGIKQQCLWIVRDYERMRREYLRMRKDIIDAGGGNYTSYTAPLPNGKSEERRAYTPGAHGTSRPMENKQAQLEALENTLTARQVRAVERAKARVGIGFPDELADALRDGIMINCQNGRKYPFERLYMTGISRSDFYRHRNQFFREIAEELELF